MKIPELIIFDLGGVIFDADFSRVFSSWALALGCHADEIQQRFRFDHAFEEFERGLLTPSSYHSHIREKLSIELSFPQFVSGWNSIYGEEFPEAEECLRLLATRHRLVAFTNTNELHSQIWPTRFKNVLSKFESVFSSVSMGIRKPQAEGFLHVLERCNVLPEDALFLDDLGANITAARELGMRTLLVDPPGQIKKLLRSVGLLE